MAYTQQRGKSKLSAGQVVALVISMGVTFYLMFNYLGPYKWIAELQLRWMGSYSEKLTLILTGLPIWGLVLLVTWPVRRVFSAGGTAPRREMELSSAMIVLVVGLGFAFFGMRKMHAAEAAGSLTPITVQSLEGGQAPPSAWVRATGVPIDRAAMGFGKGGSKDEFVPVISSPEGELPASGVRLFLKVGSRSAYRSGPAPAEYQGMLERAGLPGPVRVSMERNGLLKGGDYYVLELGQTPAGKARNARVLVWVGLCVSALGVAIGIVARFRRYVAPQQTPLITL